MFNKKNLNKVTAFSKTIALILFLVLPYLGFLFGTKYQEAKDRKLYYEKKLIDQEYQGRFLDKRLMEIRNSQIDF